MSVNRHTAILLALTTLLVASCARRTRTNVEPSTAASPAVRGAGSGLETWWWVITDQRPLEEFGPAQKAKPGETPARTYRIAEPGKSLESALEPYLGRPTPFSEVDKAKWQAHGMRVVCVPIRELDALQASLRLTGPVHRQWFGQLPDWTDIVRGPESASPKLIMVGERPEELRPGRIRLLARCWTYPVATGAGAPPAGLSLELVPHFHPAPSERARLQISTRPEDEGVVFSQLVAKLAVERVQTDPDAILIVPDSPTADWKKPVEPEPEEAGPDVEMPPSVGEAMLSSPARRSAAGVTPRSRAVVILIPRLPERFELLGR